MADNDWKSRLGMVYSTDPGFNYETDDEPEAETLPAGQQDLRVWLDRKQRAGKVVTLVKGFVGRDADLQELARIPLQKSRLVACAGSFSSWRCCARCAAPNAPRPSITPGVRTLRRSGRRSARLTCG